MLASRRMARAGVFWLVLVVLSSAPPAWAAETARAEPAQSAETANDVARFLAGMAPAADSPLAPLTRSPAWQQHARSLDAAWATLDEARLSKIRVWSAANLTDPRPVVLYTFSGPDFLYVDAFFADRATYVLSGLEPVGQVPTIEGVSHRSLGGALAGLRASVGTALNYSFFITRQMKSSLTATRLNGVLPVLYLFLARSGKTVTEVTLIGVDKDGAVVAAGTKDANPGVKIAFTGREGRAQTLYYFQTDLSDGGVKRSGFLKFCDRLGKAEVFIKSASYLLHMDGFATVRAFLIDHADAILQDDSGIPVRYLKAEDWELRPFGRYLGPIAVFHGKYQKGLGAVFRRSNPPKLEFGVGYRWRPRESNLLLAVRTPREGVAQETARQK